LEPPWLRQDGQTSARQCKFRQKIREIERRGLIDEGGLKNVYTTKGNDEDVMKVVEKEIGCASEGVNRILTSDLRK
jgi:hypothetical protein